MLNAQTKTTAALFTVSEEKRVANGPIMTGNVKVGDDSIYIGAFKRISEGGREYLNLSIGDQEQSKLYGCLFRTENKKNDDSPDYYGFITLEGDQQLSLFGRRKRGSKTEKAFIAIDVVPNHATFAEEEFPL